MLTMYDVQVKWLVAKGFAGYMVWSIDQDDYTGTQCNMGPWPMLSNMSDTLDQLIPPTTVPR